MVKVKRQKIRVHKRKTGLRRRFPLRLRTVIKFLAGVIFLSAVGIGLLRLKYMFMDSEYFLLEGVELNLYGEGGVRRNLFLKEIGGEKIAGTNVFFADLNELKRKIEESYPESKDIVVRRLFPNKVAAHGMLRKAVAQIRSDRYYFIDAEGFLLPDVKNFPDPELPIIIGIGINLAKVPAYKFSEFEKQNLDKALILINEMQSIERLAGHKLKVVDITDPGNVSFSIEPYNLEIKIGNTDFSNRLKVLAILLDQLGPDIERFKYIDLRFEDPIVGPL